MVMFFGIMTIIICAIINTILACLLGLWNVIMALLGIIPTLAYMSLFVICIPVTIIMFCSIIAYDKKKK